MNKRIKELALQTGFAASTLGVVLEDFNVKTKNGTDVEEELVKFADLLIKESIGLIVKENDGDEYGTGDDWGDGYTAGLNTAKLAIEEHFGIK